jgi:hypothetical protein
MNINNQEAFADKTNTGGRLVPLGAVLRLIEQNHSIDEHLESIDGFRVFDIDADDFENDYPTNFNEENEY